MVANVEAGVGGAVRRAWRSRAGSPDVVDGSGCAQTEPQGLCSPPPKDGSGCAQTEPQGLCSPPPKDGSGCAQTDAALLLLVARGDSAALTRLYEAHAARLFGYLLRLAGDRMTAEEILQDTMLAVWRSAGTFAGGSRVSTWLFGVARRQAYYRLRGTPPPVPSEPIDRADPAPGTDELAIAAAGGTPVAEAIARLPDHHREVVALVFVAGLPLADVAEIVGVPVGTVKSRLHHARAALARTLTSQGVTE